MGLSKKSVCLGSVVILCAVVGSIVCHGHSHDHDHVEANPAFKYSRAANEDPVIPEDEIWEEEIVDLPPQKYGHGDHGHSHGGHHGHSHGGHHGHSHGDHGHSHGSHGHSHGGSNQKEPTPEERERLRKKLHDIWDDDDEEPAGRDVWFQAIGATLLISAAPFFILFFIPLDNSEEKQWLLKIVLSFASGGLLGDAFLHLIPHAMVTHESEGSGHGHSHSHGHSHGEGHSHDMSVGIGVLSGILAFLCVEKLVRILNNGSGHGHSHGPKPKPEAKKVTEVKDKEKSKKDSEEKQGDKKESSVKAQEKKDSKDESPKKKKTADETKNDVCPAEPNEIKIAGFLNLFADCFHNFTDGLAIGASFIAGEGVGKITTLTILLHEVPHEIGDYAILIQSGMPPMKAILMQLVTALGALTGCVFSLMAPRGLGEAAATAYILPFTAGGFIYIATVSVIPELLEGSTLKQSILEILALLAGVGMMVIIAQFE